ncbi:MAG: monofunctional biosynthetic peptidoglycan transglycosylase [Betaproteobacteria bacterium]|nr:monofunctional biosynthetic peptidoglycan transglycosylase [Betaproteobacteria bacterium]MSQ88115.1 monofunctional biosynthetic peptidoglycan transglycosylase [Betaproteobacteria bacterium]
MSAAAGRVFRRTRIAWKIFCYSLGALVLAVAVVQCWFYAHVLWWRVYQPANTAFMETRLEQLREKDPKAKLAHQWVDYARIATELKRAVVAAEDAKFVGHEGFDWEAISKAMEKNEKTGRVVSGASTISQQLAKNLFLSGERSWLRKGQEAVITWMLESTLSKRRILELYLNFAEWGVGVFGAEAAARYHFGINAAALNASEAAFLAAVLPSPRRYAPGHITPYVAGRVETILARMPAAQIP